MLKLAAIIDNPGEPPAETRYRDPTVLRELGYNAMVIYETTGLSGVAGPNAPDDGEMQQWIAGRFDHVRRAIDDAHRADLDVYIFYDTLVLGRRHVCDRGSDLVCKNQPAMLCPASDAAINASAQALEALLHELPPVAGVVLRFGDNDAARLPHLIGNDIYLPHCPRCSQLGRADRIAKLLRRFHDLVVCRLDKRLIARAWNVRPNGLHDSVELAHRVSRNLPGDENDDRFILSFKFTHTDFWRYQPWNPASMVFGRRPIIYELQCQREFEAKGGIPNWQPPLWRDGAPEKPPATGLSHVAGQINLAGLWAWVRGGGWGGPFVNNETWIDANVFAVPRLADRIDITPAELAHTWIAQRLNITESDVADALHRIIEHSPQTILEAFYIGPFAERRNNPWHPNADWIHDDLLDAAAAERMVRSLPDDQLDRVVEEKRRAAERMSRDRAALQQLVNDRNRVTLEPLVHTLIYAESLFQALRDLLAGLIAHRRYRRSRDPAQAELARRKLLGAQAHWNHHTQRDGSLAGAATAFRENHFWDVTQQRLAELADNTPAADQPAPSA